MILQNHQNLTLFFIYLFLEKLLSDESVFYFPERNPERTAREYT